MPLILCCPECLELCEPDGGPPTAYGLQFSESGLYRWKCEDGHTVALGLNAARFEVLFEISLQALADGYARESVATAAAALERFYEFYIRLIWEARVIDDQVREMLWKAVSKSSERQLGVFAATFAMETGRLPPLLHQRQVELRNEVVHKGRIATPKEALAFAQAVADLAHPPMREVIEKYPDAAAALSTSLNSDTLRELKPDEKFSCWWMWALPLSRARAEPNACNVAQEIERRRHQKSDVVAI